MLPHGLVEAFKATLEEVTKADLILHLVDVSHPKAIDQSRATYKVLDQIGASDKPIITVLNKIDKVTDPEVVKKLKAYFTKSVAISALKKEGFAELLDAILVAKFQ